MDAHRPIGTVAAISRYPVKSLQGESLAEGAIVPAGLEGDRGWGIVNTDTGKVLTAKRTGPMLDAAARLTPAGPEILLPDGTVLVGAGPTIDLALSEWLELPVSLRPAGDTATSFTMSFNVEDEDVDAFDWSTPPGTYVDLAPIHLLTTASLAAAAASHPDGDWSPHRFRPTVLIESDEALTGFIENGWTGAALSLGEVVVDVFMPTVRCSLPTKAQSARGLGRDLQVFTSLKASNEQNLGSYATVRTPGLVRVGDAVELLPSPQSVD